MRQGPRNARIRPPAVAGLFYPRDAAELRAAIDEYLNAAPGSEPSPTSKAWIVPHAGYVYSGPVAAVVYRRVQTQRRSVRRVVLIGPSHRVPLQGIAVPECGAFATPLGAVRIDPELKEAVLRCEDVVASDRPHALEHAVEVQLPFLQTILGDFTFLPLVAGDAMPWQVAAVLDEVWDAPETLVFASSDLSHYHRYDVARLIDAATSKAIVGLETNITGEQACGAVSINGLLHVARARGLQVTELARCNSGDTAGDRARVVGYGAFEVQPAAA
jgi:AmmeMemoRadiSam system protein B